MSKKNLTWMGRMYRIKAENGKQKAYSDSGFQI
jgi:hypothetical protein